MNWILVPVRNGIAYTKAALPTFHAQDIGDIRVLLIDNDSSDGTTQWARSQPNMVYWHRRPGLSVAASWNLGLKWLFREQKEAHVLVVNNDVELRPDTYRHLVNDGGMFVTATGVQEHEKIMPPYPDPDPKHKRLHPDYSCFMIRRECWQQVPFDEDFAGAYAEDMAHHVCLHRAGIVAMSLELPFYHVKSGTVKASDSNGAQKIHDAAERNRERFKEKFGVIPGSPEYYALFGTKPGTSEYESLRGPDLA